MAINLNINERGREFMVNIAAIFTIAGSGILMAIIYFIMAKVQTAFESVNCLIPQNNLVSTCQEWFTFALYPVLNLKIVLIYGSYFYMFGIVFGLFYLGFKTKKHPALLIIHIVMSLIVSYLAIEIGNIYRTFLDNPIMYDILLPFPIYNKVMIYFPQFVFFVVFVSGIIGFMGIFRGRGQFNEGVDELG